MKNKEYTQEQLTHIGAKVVENRVEKEKWIAKNRPKWIAEGKRLKSMRKALKIALADISERVAVSIPVLIKLEAGEPIERRPLVYAAYQTAADLILAEHRLVMQEFKTWSA